MQHCQCDNYSYDVLLSDTDEVIKNLNTVKDTLTNDNDKLLYTQTSSSLSYLVISVLSTENIYWKKPYRNREELLRNCFPRPIMKLHDRDNIIWDITNIIYNFKFIDNVEIHSVREITRLLERIVFFINHTECIFIF